MLSVLAQCEAFFLESQACLPYLSGVGTEYADQAEKAAQTRQTNDNSKQYRQQSTNLVNGFYSNSWKTVADFKTIKKILLDNANREGLGIEVKFFHTSGASKRTLNHLN